MTQTLQIIALLDAALSLAINAGVNIERFRQLKDANGGAPLTEAQINQLAAEAEASVGRL